ncbi:MAG: hypothetical protein ACREAO_00585 [Nitrososphaera sp.]
MAASRFFWRMDKYTGDHYNAVLTAALLAVMSIAGPAIAQATLNPVLAEDCKRLEIGLEKCSEQEILTRRSINPEQPETGLDPVVASILAGCTATFIAGVLYVKRASREKSNQKPQ